jgi:hypothetical protein
MFATMPACSARSALRPDLGAVPRLWRRDGVNGCCRAAHVRRSRNSLSGGADGGSDPHRRAQDPRSLDGAWLPHLIETTAFPLASHSPQRRRGAKLTMRSSGPRPSDGLAAERPVCAEGASSAAGWMRPSWLHEAHSTITKSPALRSLTRAV